METHISEAKINYFGDDAPLDEWTDASRLQRTSTYFPGSSPSYL